METTSDVIPVSLIHRIQSFLPVKEAARTCILSKSWLHEWSTIRTLRFPKQEEVRKQNYNNLIDRTLLRYHNDNIPIETFDLDFRITDYQKSSLAENWIRQVVSSSCCSNKSKSKRSISCLKELSLCLRIPIYPSLTLPKEIFYGGENVNLSIIKVRAYSYNNPPRIISSNNNIPTCVSLRVLELTSVNISDDVLDKLLSTCILLEKITLFSCEGFNTIKVKNLPCLRELQISLKEENHLLEIDQVQRLGFFRYDQDFTKPLPFNTNSLGSVTRLHVTGVIVDDAFLDMVKFKLPFLESLALKIVGSSFYWKQKRRLIFTSFSLKRLEIKWIVDTINWPYDRQPVDVEVYAPELSSFIYNGNKPIHRLLFPNIAPGKIDLSFSVKNSFNHSFFLKMKEILNLSTKFDIEIIEYALDSSVRKKNVKQLSLITCLDERVWENTRFFDTLFSICNPLNVKAQQYKSNENECYSNIVVTATKTTGLKDGGINFRNGDLEVLTSRKRIKSPYIEFKLTWPSHQ